MCGGKHSSLGSWLALLCVLVLALSPCVAQGQSSTPLSTDTAQPSSLTTSTVEFVSQALRPLLVTSLEQSQTTDRKLLALQQQIEQDRLQRIADDKQRQIEQQQRQQEQQNSAVELATLSARAEALQNFSDRLLPLLTDFSGSEAEKQAAALAAVGKIKADAKALALQVGVLKIGCITFGVGLVAVAIYEGGHAFGWW